MTRAFVVTCPKCNKSFQASYEDFRHKSIKLRCPYCNHRFLDKESPSVDSEIALLRVLTLRTYSAMSASTGLDLALHLRTLRIVTMAVTIIEKLERHKTPAFSGPQDRPENFPHCLDYTTSGGSL